MKTVHTANVNHPALISLQPHKQKATLSLAYSYNDNPEYLRSHRRGAITKGAGENIEEQLAARISRLMTYPKPIP